MPNNRFGKEYKAQKTQLDGATLGGVCAGVLDVQRVLGADGPDRSRASSLDTLRDVSLKFKEAEKIMEAAGLDPAGTGIPADAGVRNAGLLKFLRHLYMVSARCSQQVWVLDTPAAFTMFPQDQLLRRTDDHRYAFKGIGVGANLSDTDAANNADSWAFFAADCAGALTDNEILRATGGTAGALTQLAKNWN